MSDINKLSKHTRIKAWMTLPKDIDNCIRNLQDIQILRL